MTVITRGIFKTPVLVLLFVVVNAACGSEPPPAGPSTAAPSPSASSISGQVRDTAFRAISGAGVEVLDGSRAGLSTTTDNAGHFLLNGPFESPTQVRATKEGYAANTIKWTCLDSSCSPPPVLSFTLRGLTSPADIAGDYTVTMSADLACADLLSAARTRTYSAALSLYQGVDWNYRAQLAGATFLADDGGFFPFLDGFDARVASDHVVLDLDDFGGPAVVEQIAPNTYLAYRGEGAASVASGSSTISATFDGYVELCALKSPMEHGYECRQDQRADPTPSQPVTYTRCESRNHQLVLTRRP